MNFDFNSFSFDVFGAAIYIKNSWLVRLRERVLEIVCDEGSLTDLRVSDEHELQLLHAILKNDFRHV